MRFIATCKMGLESTVNFQLRRLGIEVVATEDARVVFEGGYDAMARALLWLRTAERVLMVAAEFPATSFDALFEGTKRVDWKRYLRPDSNIHVNGKSAKSTLFSVSDCQSIVKKAVVEKLRESYRCTTIPETGAEIAAYLRGAPLQGTAQGWTLLTAGGLSLGWVKGSGGTLKNHYPKGLRRVT